MLISYTLNKWAYVDIDQLNLFFLLFEKKKTSEADDIRDLWFFES